MGVKTSLAAITPITAETLAATVAGEDLAGCLVSAQAACSDAIRLLNILATVMPAGSNKTALLAQVTALT